MSVDGDGRAGSARRQAVDAAARAAQLADRLRRLRSGETANVDDADRSRLAAALAATAAIRQYEYSRDAHLSAARAHESAALAFDRSGNVETGQRHRDAARADGIGAALDSEAAALARAHVAGATANPDGTSTPTPQGDL
ncbi:MAG TPA: hypothetical protein VGH69_07385 [Mycobacterium sp.]